MILINLGNTAILFLLGLTGWFLLSKIRLPAAYLLGPAILIGAMRVMEFELPDSMPEVFSAAQVLIGIYVGAKLDRSTLRDLKPLSLLALIVVAWAILIIFLIGYALAYFTDLDLYTAMLSASLGGLPEITIVALSSNADVPVIVVTQLIRMMGTLFAFPLITEWLKRREGKNRLNKLQDTDKFSRGAVLLGERDPASSPSPGIFEEILHVLTSLKRSSRKLKILERIVITLTTAAAGGLLFDHLGVPAGLLVGSTFFAAALSIAGYRVIKMPVIILDLVMVIVGINIADNISRETLSTLGDPNLVQPILIATILIFFTSFLVSLILYKVSGWDYPTCFLSAAPAGFSVMTLLALKNGLDPFKISMLHLCRLLAINISLPFIFMILTG